MSEDTIAAIATPPGRGGVGIVRISGPNVPAIARQLWGDLPPIRQAAYRRFGDIDEGIALYFQAPHSFTGEDVLELQGHGGPVILDNLLTTVCALGARIAMPGEFSKRAFLNGKCDLAQAEAIADLIDAQTQAAAKSALRSLSGEFSQKIKQLAADALQLRMMVEAAIDFPDEEIDFLTQDKIAEKIIALQGDLEKLLGQAKQGQLLREGLTLAIAGAPNAGKSSLLNALTQQNTAIVTPIAGTTRDCVKETIQIDGLPIHLVDTAGIRDEADIVEQEGIRRAHQQQQIADHVLLVVDGSLSTDYSALELEIIDKYTSKVTVIINKIDKMTTPFQSYPNQIHLSAKTGEGLEQLWTHLKTVAGFQGEDSGIFLARRRHLDALNQALEYSLSASVQYNQKAFECVAEDLRLAHLALGEIVGKVSSDDLLGEIFSRFCIGK